MHQELARDDDFRALFLDQAATALALRHPNLVRTLEVVADPDACGLTMEFLQGQTLARVLERLGRLRFPVDLHLHILSLVLGALDHAHRCAGPRHAGSFMHRDVSPSNVFITYDGQVKLLGTGFGNALRALESRLGRPLLDVKYAAPEVLLGYPPAPAADLFAVGVMVWEAAARQARVSSDDPKALLQRRTRGEELDLASAWPDAPEPLIALCTRALAINARERYQTAHDFRADLDAYLGRATETSDAVLARLPELMDTLFGPEREQMQLFIGARLGELDRDAAAVAGLEEADDELTPHGDRAHDDQRAGGWTAEPNGNAPLAERDGVDAGSRTGLRRARPEPAARRATGVHEKALRRSGSVRQSGAEPRPAAQERASRATELLGPRAVVPARQPAASLPPSSVELPAHETTTAGHRAYSSSLDARAREPRSGLRLSPDVLGAVALLLGSLVAVYSIYRHSQRDSRADTQKLAIQAEARELPAMPAIGAAGSVLTAQPAGALTAEMQPAGDAGAPVEEHVAGPAFFDGRAAEPPEPPPPLNADELPSVDPALRSLQDAIVMAAKAHRVAVERRRARKAEPAQRSSSVGPAAPRPIDEDDPYGEVTAP